jgi:holliday junction DNA helicase RuvA
MIDQAKGCVVTASEKSITVFVAGLGLAFLTPRSQEIEIGKDIHVFAYLHWNQDKGPSLFGFVTELERKVFLMLIDCHKIGPQIALQVLSQLEPVSFLEICATSGERELSKIKGIGPKKAKQLVGELCEKATNLLTMSGISRTSEISKESSCLKDVSQALKSLGYSPQEISEAMRAGSSEDGNNVTFDLLMRSSLAYLAKAR